MRSAARRAPSASASGGRAPAAPGRRRGGGDGLRGRRARGPNGTRRVLFEYGRAADSARHEARAAELDELMRAGIGEGEPAVPPR
jgi:hypothetical protein